jgi:hypothetical protein
MMKMLKISDRARGQFVQVLGRIYFEGTYKVKRVRIFGFSFVTFLGFSAIFQGSSRVVFFQENGSAGV